jgi:hypothetical protein
MLRSAAIVSSIVSGSRVNNIFEGFLSVACGRPDFENLVFDALTQFQTSEISSAFPAESKTSSLFALEVLADVEAPAFWLDLSDHLDI